MTVHIFQIGCKDFGRYGFEKLIDKEKYFPEDVVFEAICEKDFERKERAEKFVEAAGAELDFYEDVDELYNAAKEIEDTVLIYDAGPVQKNSNNIQRSLRNEFYHITEKPPSLSREEHIQERKLAAKHSVHYKVDFIERENPVVKKALQIVEKDNLESIKVFRESSTGVQRLMQPVKQAHVNEGCVLDKMVHDIYIMDFLGEQELELESVENTMFMPKDIGGEKFLRTDGGISREISERNALGKTSAYFSAKDTSVELNSSWLGVSNEAKKYDNKVQEKFGNNLVRSEYSEIDGKGFLDQEARFFIIESDQKILGDMLNYRLYNLDTGKEIEIENYPRDQLYRVLERAVIDAAEGTVNKVTEDEIDNFMNALFDIQEQAGEKEVEVFDALDKSSEKIRAMLVSDKADLDKDELKGVAS